MSATQVVYACTYLHCESASVAVFELGVLGPIKVWVNGVEVAREPIANGKLAPASSRVFVQLPGGESFVLLKLCGPGEAKLHAAIVGRDGKRIVGLTYRQPLDPKEVSETLQWAHLGPFLCHREACVLDTKFPPELRLAGPPQDISSFHRWAPPRGKVVEPSGELLNGGFESVDENGQPHAWRAMWGTMETVRGPQQGRLSLRFPPSQTPVSREVLSHAFTVDPRKPAFAAVVYRVPSASHGTDGVALSCSIQWLDGDLGVVGVTPISGVEAPQQQGGVWRRVEEHGIRPPHHAKFARVQLKSWGSQREVLIDEVVYEVADASQ